MLICEKVDLTHSANLFFIRQLTISWCNMCSGGTTEPEKMGQLE